MAREALGQNPQRPEWNKGLSSTGLHAAHSRSEDEKGSGKHEADGSPTAIRWMGESAIPSGIDAPDE
jgi:hypothetical protein